MQLGGDTMNNFEERILKQRNAKDGHSKKIRERQEGFLKPGVKRRLEKAENTKNSRKRNRERY